MFDKIRWWIIGKLVGDSSYIKNCVLVGGKIFIRPDHFICGCTFTAGAYVDSGSARYPETHQKEQGE
jgi:hypothetical protein